jgi:hypothetical protein
MKKRYSKRGDYRLIVSPEPDGYCVDFEIREREYLYSFPDYWQAILGGRLKWDGCCDWDLSTHCQVHFCDLSQIDEIALLFKDMERIAPDVMSAWAPC